MLLFAPSDKKKSYNSLYIKYMRHPFPLCSNFQKNIYDMQAFLINQFIVKIERFLLSTNIVMKKNVKIYLNIKHFLVDPFIKVDHIQREISREQLEQTIKISSAHSRSNTGITINTYVSYFYFRFIGTSSTYRNSFDLTLSYSSITPYFLLHLNC